MAALSIPDVESVIFSTRTNERVDTTTHYRENLDPRAFQKLEELRGKIAAVLLQHRIRVLDESVLDLPVPGLRAGEDVFLQEPLRVRDAFFFRGA